MPVIGLGTWKSPAGKVGAAVEYALVEAGYRHIDGAYIYHNEKEVGQGLAKAFTSGRVKREEAFITSKLWTNFFAKSRVELACKNTLSDLGLEYLDLYLMHWGIATPPESGDDLLDEQGVLQLAPVSVREVWEEMEKLVASGLVRAIGVANFTAPMLIDLLTYAKIKPAVNQIELHPYNQQSTLIDFCNYKGIAVTAYSPLGSPGNSSGKPVLLQDETIDKIAQSHGKTSAQILIRWATQRETIVIPKSTTPERIKENIDVFDFELSKKEMALIAALDRRYRYVDPAEWWGFPYFD